MAGINKLDTLNRLALLLLVLLALPGMQAAGQAAANLDELIQRFRDQAGPKELEKTAAEILALGPAAAGEFAKTLEKMRTSLTKSYLEELEDAARAARKKVKVDRGKVKAARAVLAELRARGKRALYEVSIVSKGDPALATLRKELLLDVDTVVAGDGELATTRERLKVVHACQVSCEKVSGAAPAGAGKKRKKKSGKAVAPPATPGTADEALARKELLAVVIATLAGGGDGRVLEKNEKSSPAISGREADGILDLNILRILLGLKPLAIDVALCKAARDHANDMFEKDFCSHTSPVPGKETFELRAARFGTSARSENLGRGQETPQEATMGWFHSPGHHINMLETRWKIVGQGEAGKCWVLLFR